MAYVVVVFAIINTAALALVAFIILGFVGDLPTYVETAIQDEVRKQDDRIEKRVQRAQGPAEDTAPTTQGTLRSDGVRAGQPTRR